MLRLSKSNINHKDQAFKHTQWNCHGGYPHSVWWRW